MRSPARVLGIDPGFASVGWAVCDVNLRGEVPVKIGLIRSKPSKYESDKQHDRVVRLNEIFGALQEVFEDGVIEDSEFRQFDWIVVEDVGYVPDAGAMGKVAHVIGGVVALAQRRGIPVTIIQPAAVKVALLGRAPAKSKKSKRDHAAGDPPPQALRTTVEERPFVLLPLLPVDRKEAVAQMLLHRHHDLATMLEAFPRALREHPTDAVAVVRAALLLDTGLRRALQVVEDGARRRAAPPAPDPR